VALLVASVVVGAGSQAPPRPILAVSVSRSGGDTLCDLACRQFHGGPDMDCRLEGGAFHYLKALNGSVAAHNLTCRSPARAMRTRAARASLAERCERALFVAALPPIFNINEISKLSKSKTFLSFKHTVLQINLVDSGRQRGRKRRWSLRKLEG
jgi:hypothetical protein